MGKLKYKNIPVITSIGKKKNLDYCVLPVIQKYIDVLSDRYTLKEDVRGKMLNNFYIDKIISVEGGWSVIVRGYDIFTKKYYAVKIMRPGIRQKDFRSELEAFNILSKYPNCNKHIVCMFKTGYYKPTKPKPEYIEAFYNDEKTKVYTFQSLQDRYRYMVLELMSSDLYDFFTNMKIYQGDNWGERYPDLVRKIFKGVAQGLASIHRAGFAHSDLKPENVLVKFKDTEDPCEFFKKPDASRILVKLSDLGFLCTSKKNNRIAKCIFNFTPGYAPPEVIRGVKKSLRAGQKLDIWALGMILGWMLYGYEIGELAEISSDFSESLNEDDERTETEIYEDFEQNYYEFIAGLPKYKSGYREFDNDMTIMFHRMLSLDPKIRDSAKDLLIMLPEVS